MGKLKTLAPLVAGLAPRVKAAPKVAEQFYSSREWRSLVARIKRERRDRCERPGCTTPTQRVIAHPLVARTDGGAELDEGTLATHSFTHSPHHTPEAHAERSPRHVQGGW